MKRFILAVILCVMAMPAFAATRDFPVEWIGDCATTEGDNLDPDGDGICELLTGYRVFFEDGTLVEEIPDPSRQSSTYRYNMPFGTTQCFKMTAYMVVNGTEYESEFSNVGACREVVPGNPNRPNVTN